MGLKGLTIKSSYVGKGDSLLHDFLLPVINESQYYDRIAGYFSIESLLAISQGIEVLYKRQGRMRLLIGIHSLPAELIEASLYQEEFEKQISRIRREIKEGIASLTDSLEKRRLATLAWMIQDRLLEVKVAAVKGEGIFHPKTLIFTDENDEKVVAVGSPNETSWGLGANFEQLMVAKSWEANDAVRIQEEFFEDLWNNRFSELIVSTITDDMSAMIKDSLGDEFDELSKERLRETPHLELIKESSKMLSNYFVSGDIPALYMHQERAVIDALSRWPVRVLFADEVGLGKTFEIAATMTFLIKNCGVKRSVILAPKAVLQQWKDELYEHFKIDAWIYDSAKKTYFNNSGESIYIGNKNPLGISSPNIILMSAQFARGSRDNDDLFTKKDSILPDLLVVDEAHSARVSKGLDGKSKKTRMYRMLEQIAPQVPHLILATATPMQKDADEYHAILQLLGLPSMWKKKRNYQLSLKLISTPESPDLSDTYNAGRLLSKTVSEMKPDLGRLNANEIEAVNNLLKYGKDTDELEVGNYVRDNWSNLRGAFVKLHPANLLTVRNTRRSLTQIGYIFPKRNLNEVSIDDSFVIQLFYNKVNEYLSNEGFSVERVLYPSRQASIGFVRISYQQRVASSLFSCKESLQRRFEKIDSLRKKLKGQLADNSTYESFGYADSLDEIEVDDLFGSGIDDDPLDSAVLDIKELNRVSAIEATALAGLIHEVDQLLETCGDPKISKSIELASEKLEKGAAVLLFSRYTDTIEALLREFKKSKGDKRYVYGIYTGSKSVIVDSGKEEVCDKKTIKDALSSGRLRLMFCSDAASEGLNLQAANVLINVDVPWTPARLEQRIGRIARLGQLAKEVDIYNVWYPYSVESRMYHRIQKRLEETNLAVGEFPEVVASSIRLAVLENREQDETGLNQLKEIRNSFQVKALEELWGSSKTSTNISSTVRRTLMEFCKKEFSVTDTSRNGKIVSFGLPDGTTINLTELPGEAESISLKSKPWTFIDCEAEGLELVTDGAGRGAVFALSRNKDRPLIKHENVFDILLGREMNDDDYLQGYPIMLPDSDALDLSYSIESECPDKPHYWF